MQRFARIVARDTPARTASIALHNHALRRRRRQACTTHDYGFRHNCQISAGQTVRAILTPHDGFDGTKPTKVVRSGS